MWSRRWVFVIALCVGCYGDPQPSTSPERPEDVVAPQPDEEVLSELVSMTRGRGGPLRRELLFHEDSSGTRVAIMIRDPPAGIEVGARTLLTLQVPTWYRSEVGQTGWSSEYGFVVSTSELHDARSTLAHAAHAVWGHSRDIYVSEVTQSMARAPGLTLDLSVSPVSIEEWSRSQAVELSSLDELGGASLEPRDLLESPHLGVYRGGDVVALAIPKGSEFCEVEAALRRFARHTDLVVGGIASATTALVLGRRSSPETSTLEPLRVESLRLLLDAGASRALAQRCEVDNPFAGIELGDSGAVWVPLRLGPGLEDSELGLLLVMADHELKTSSLGLSQVYAGFERVEPAVNPAREALSRELSRGHRLSMGFDAERAGYILEYEGLEVYAPVRTGSLPLSYESSSRRDLSQARRSAQEFMASTNDPTLARIARYVIVAQILAELGQVSLCDGSSPPSGHAGWAKLEALTYQALLDLRADRIDATQANRRRKTRKRLAELRRLLNGLGEVELERLASDLNHAPMRDPALGSKAARALELLQQDWAKELLASHVGVQRAREAFTRDRSASDGPIGTPRALYVSLEYRDSLGGGHRLGLEVPRHRVDTARAPGAPKLIEQDSRLRAAELHPDDIEYLADLSANFDLSSLRSSRELRKALARSRKGNPSEQTELWALSATEAPRDPARLQVGWRVLASGPSLSSGAAGEGPLLRVARVQQEARYEAIFSAGRGGRAVMLEAGSLAALGHFLNEYHFVGEGPVHIEFGPNMHEPELRALQKTIEALNVPIEVKFRPFDADLHVRSVRFFDEQHSEGRAELKLLLMLEDEVEDPRVLVLDGASRGDPLRSLRGWVSRWARAEPLDARFFEALEVQAKTLGFDIEMILVNHIKLTGLGGP